ncbi:hypothetical protein [Thalassospira profundimaris]|uniref:Glycosyl hydrolase family 32 N-terminal domain-containing protein n=1 Tax=Thalassospira profundimaris TaxID=502049 RepID=A0A367WHP9_9PROT|nr:hypothetical protein [Thalassospira profundimaris]RCK40975.1 hypothetical protein TH30_22410 [Thalassospira profundimaris]
MRWKKIGKIFSSDLLPQWSSEHSQLPVPVILEDRVRIFFSTRNANGQATPISFDVALDDLTKVIQVNTNPILELGSYGSFDQSGIMPSDVVYDSGRHLMYYIGWRTGTVEPYHTSIGVAVSEDNCQTFRKMFAGPIISRSKHEPFITTTPRVMINGSSDWRLWYSSGTKWEMIDGKLEPIYVIMSATSENGIDWNRDASACISLKHDLECLTSPSVIRIGENQYMWMCYRDAEDYRDGGGSYRIGFAHSRDRGVSWDRHDDDAGISLSSSSEWDSKMMAYPYVFEHARNIFMLYNGNDFGRSGIGLAQLIDF